MPLCTPVAQGQLIQKLAERIAEHRMAHVERMEAYQMQLQLQMRRPVEDMLRAFRSAAGSSQGATVIFRQHANGGVYAEAPDAQLQV